MTDATGSPQNRAVSGTAAKPRVAQSTQESRGKLGDLPGLQAAVNDASSRAAALWLSFLTFMAYLTMTVGAVTHDALLKQTAIKLPVLNVDLPLVAFFWIAPLFFLLFHFYLFLQLVILVRKVATFDANVQAAIPAEQDREEYRRRLDTFLVVQFLYGATEERKGITGHLLRCVAVITLVILPILMLLQFQLTFLPYHDAWVTWIHRLAIVVDLRLAWVFWFAIRKGDGEIHFPEIEFAWRALFRRATVGETARRIIAEIVSAIRHAWNRRRAGLLSSTIVLFAAFFVFAFKDERIANLLKLPVPSIENNQLVWELTPIADIALHGPINMVEGRPKTWFSNVLVVPNKKIIDEKSVENDFPSLSLRGRNLSGAVLIGSDLRNVDFTGANLNDARLDRALLTRAKFNCVSPFNMRPKPGWPNDECTWLQRASLSEAKLEAANFDGARMHGAIMIGAELKGAQLTGAQLQGAMLINAQLQAALIQGANLNNAFLNGALLIGAKIRNTQLSGVLLGDTIFQMTFIEHDKSKFRQAKESKYGEQAPDEPELAVVKANRKISEQFMHAEIRQNEQVAPTEDVAAGFDFETLTKLRQTVIAQLAAENKMRNTDFQKVYREADESAWGSIRDALNKGDKPPSTIDQYAIGFACDAGSSPFITSALIRDEKIMWVLDRISNRGKAIEQAIEVLSALESPSCAGAKGLKPSDMVAIGFLKQRFISKQGSRTARDSSGEQVGEVTAVGQSTEPAVTQVGVVR